MEKKILDLKRNVENLENELANIKQRLEKFEKASELDLIDIEFDAELEKTDFKFKRVAMYLRNMGIRTVYDFITAPEEKVMSCRGVGPSTQNQIRKWMSTHNMTFIK